MSSSQTLPFIEQKAFNEKLKTRKYEDLEAVSDIEALLKKKRGFVFKMPQAGESVILLVSGGIDSVTAWGYLLNIGIKVFPLFLDRGSQRKEKEWQATLYFSKFFKERHPHLYEEPMHFSTHLPPPEIEQDLADPQKIHPSIILDNLNLDKQTSSYLSVGISPYLFALHGVIYSTYLRDTKNLAIKNIMVGVGANDGTEVPSQSFTALRSTTLSMCLGTGGDWDWNFASLYIERELGWWLEKKDVVTLGKKLKIPLEKTWSCYRAEKYQCGNRCLTCLERRGTFESLGIEDKTNYMQDQLSLTEQWNMAKKRIKQLLTSYLA